MQLDSAVLRLRGLQWSLTSFHHSSFRCDLTQRDGTGTRIPRCYQGILQTNYGPLRQIHRCQTPRNGGQTSILRSGINLNGRFHGYRLGNGFLFEHFTAEGFRWAIDQAMSFFMLPDNVKRIQIERIMRQSIETFNYRVAAKGYIKLYEKMLQQPVVSSAGH